MVYELQKFYYDTAQAFNPYTLPSFKKKSYDTRMVLGSIAAGGSLYPDHVVFLGPGARALSEGETPAQVAQAASAAGLAPPSGQ